MKKILIQSCTNLAVESDMPLQAAVSDHMFRCTEDLTTQLELAV
jgi:hypothetical protein